MNEHCNKIHSKVQTKNNFHSKMNQTSLNAVCNFKMFNFEFLEACSHIVHFSFFYILHRKVPAAVAVSSQWISPGSKYLPW